MKKLLMNNRGITLMSLVIYVTVMFVVLALIMRVTIYFTKNISDVADTSLETEFEKINMYMLQETKKTNNYVTEVAEDGTSITFSDGNKFEFVKENEAEEGQIYFNEALLCKNVKECSFSTTDNVETQKTTITINITINETQKDLTFIINMENQLTALVTEENYIMSKARVPEEYQEIEYLELDNSNPYSSFICSNIEISNISTIEFKYSLKSILVQFHPMVFTSYTSSDNTSVNPYICVDGSKEGSWTISPTIDKNLIDTPTEFTITNSGTTTNFLKIGGWSSNAWTAIGDYYYVRIFDTNNDLIFNGIPCYRKSDGEIGLYNTVRKNFFTNQGTGEFLKGPDVD